VVSRCFVDIGLVGFEGLDQALTALVWESLELNVEAEVERATVGVVTLLRRHTFVWNLVASLRTDLAVDNNAQKATIKRFDPARSARKNFFQADILSQDEVIAASLVAVVLLLL
jgi:hypothetical protein